MHTNDQLPDSDLGGRLTGLAAHLDAERATWDPAISLEPSAASPSRRPMLLAAAAAVLVIGGAGLALTPGGTDPAHVPVADAPISTESSSRTLGPTTPSTVPTPTSSSAPAPIEAHDLPPDATPNPDARTPGPCPPTPADLTVPDVVGMAYQDAEAVMTDAGFRLLIVGHDPADHVADAVITAQHFTPRDVEPCWNVVSIAFDPSIDLGS